MSSPVSAKMISRMPMSPNVSIKDSGLRKLTAWVVTPRDYRVEPAIRTLSALGDAVTKAPDWRLGWASAAWFVSVSVTAPRAARWVS
jgi:hypothetical protein